MNGSPPAILIYDGDCGFCTRSARWLERQAKGYRIAPYQSIDLDPLGVSEAQAQAAVLWIGADGAVVTGHDAIAAALRHSARPRSWIGAALTAPPLRWLGRRVYPVVARNRHRLPGATDSCRIER